VWAVNANPVPGSVWTWLGPTFGADWATPPPALNQIATNVKGCGALGNGSIDDTASIEACIGTLSSTGGTLFFPPGTYCIKTGPLTVARAGITLLGSNREVSVLSACGADVSIVNMSGYHDEIVNLGILGSQNPLTVNNTVNLLGGSNGCVECTINNSKIEGGNAAIYANAYEVYIEWTRADLSYGPALVYFTNTGGYLFRDKFDQAYPQANPAFGVTPPVAWAATTAYPTGAIVKVTSGARTYILQAMIGGTSAGSKPSIPAYRTNVTDGSVTWQLSSSYPYYGVQFDTNSGFDAFLSYSDFSANFTNAIVFTNTLAGVVPHNIYLDHLTIGSILETTIYAPAGYGISITDSHLGNCLETGCTMISIGSGFQGDITITGNWIGGTGTGGTLNGGTGVFIGGGYRTVVSNNIFTTEQTAVGVAANVQDFVVNNNEFASSVFGCATTGVQIAAGTSNFYTIMGNNLSCVTNALADAGTGTDKQILNVSSLSTVRGLPTSCTGYPAGTLWNSSGTVKVC
jgi:hypothetical protein